MIKIAKMLNRDNLNFMTFLLFVLFQSFLIILSNHCQKLDELNEVSD